MKPQQLLVDSCATFNHAFESLSASSLSFIKSLYSICPWVSLYLYLTYHSPLVHQSHPHSHILRHTATRKECTWNSFYSKTVNCQHKQQQAVISTHFISETAWKANSASSHHLYLIKMFLMQRHGKN